MSNEECWCFPKEQEFEKQYVQLMKENKYLAEKTTPTMVEHLAGKKIKSYDIIPYYAQYDFMKYLGCFDQNTDENASSTCVVVRMSADMDIVKMRKSLELIAKPCKCDF